MNDATRITRDQVLDNIADELFSLIPGTTLTVCVLTLRNGFTVTGESACADSRNFDVKIGEELARADAVRKIWPLMGYALKERMAAMDVGVGSLSFSAALNAAKDGLSIARSGWNGKGMWIKMQTPDANSKMTLPYLYLCYPADAQNTPGARVPWLASQTDLLANDWCIL